MRKTLLIVLLISPIFVLTSCFSGGKTFKYNAVKRLEVGDSEQKVMQLLGGQPDRVINSDGTYILRWHDIYGPIWHYKMYGAEIRFSKDGKMVEIKTYNTTNAGF